MSWRLAIFGTVLLAIAIGTHVYMWRRLVRDPRWPRLWRGVGTLVLAAGGLSIPTAMALGRFAARDAVAPFPLAAFTWMGLVFYLVLFLATWDLALWVRRRLSRPAIQNAREAPAASAAPLPTAAPPVTRREALQRATAVGIVGASGAVGLWGVRRALGEFETPEIEVKLPRLPPALSGMRIALLSDIHIGPLLDRRFLQTVVERTNALRPDVVAITGDLVDGSVQKLAADVSALQGLRSRWGTYFVTGNHEYYSGPEAWAEALTRMGIRVLGNECVPLGDRTPGGATIDLAGVHDRHAAWASTRLKPDFAQTFAGRDAEREVVLLAHQPKDIEHAVKHAVGLQLSGHTHGGQLWPFAAAAWLVQPYLAGLHTHEAGTRIYVTRGTGFWGPPMRVLAPAEISLLVLV